MNTNVGRALVGGLIGTAAMTMMMYFVAPLMLGGPMDIAQMLAGMLSTTWAAGMLVHAILGIVVLPLIFLGIYGALPGEPWVRGLVWGMILWLMAEAIVIPMAGGGFFHSQQGGLMAVMGSLMGHAIYGIILGAITGHPSAKSVEAYA